jgi:hypothetical protein
MSGCTWATLAPGASQTCTAAYTVTQADIDAGTVDNTAKATGTDRTGNVSANASAELGVQATAGISLAKTVAPTVTTQAGQTVTYTFEVTNTGGLTLSTVGVAERSFTGTGIAPALTGCSWSSLAPGAKQTCTATYVVTQADIDTGFVDNTARASGTARTGAVSDDATAKLGVQATASIALAKSVAPAQVTQAGQSVTYTFEV